MKKLKVIGLIAFVAIISLQCNNTSSENSAAINDNMKFASTDSNAETSAKEKANHKIEHLTKATFIEKVFDYENSEEWQFKGDKPCIIDFYADWCAPCKMIAPILEDLAKEYDGEIVIYKINTEEQQELASAFGIRSIPSLLFCPKEGQPQMAQGALPKEQFKKAIEDVLKVKK